MMLTIVAAMGLRAMLSRDNVRRDGLRYSQDGLATASMSGSMRDKKGNNEVDHGISTGYSDSRGIMEERTDKQDLSVRHTL
jgi:hypothetical protein